MFVGLLSTLSQGPEDPDVCRTPIRCARLQRSRMFGLLPSLEGNRSCDSTPFDITSASWRKRGPFHCMSQPRLWTSPDG